MAEGFHRDYRSAGSRLGAGIEIVTQFEQELKVRWRKGFTASNLAGGVRAAGT
jgi:hypothetical protein